MSEPSPSKKRKPDEAVAAATEPKAAGSGVEARGTGGSGAAVGADGDGDSKMTEGDTEPTAVGRDGDAKMAAVYGGGGGKVLPEMIVVQMLSTEGDVPGAYGLPFGALTKEVHAWLRGDTRDENDAHPYTLQQAKKHGVQALVDELEARANSRKKADMAAEAAYNKSAIRLHWDFNNGRVIMLSGTVLYAPDKKPVGKFAGALCFRERN